MNTGFVGARAWLSNYHGSIDVVSLRLAYLAGVASVRHPEQADKDQASLLRDEVLADETDELGVDAHTLILLWVEGAQDGRAPREPGTLLRNRTIPEA